MTGYVDIAKIKNRKAELEAELGKLNQLLEMIENFSAPKPIITVKPIVSVESVEVSKPNIVHVRGFTPGLRRAVTMALYTGPMTMEDLSKALAWEFNRTKQVVGSMLKFNIVFLNEHGRLTLSEEGNKQADWFIKNIGKLVYSPKDMKE